MITYSGVHIHPCRSENQEAVRGIPTPMDIAVQMGRICRYGGAVWMPLLTHSVFVACLAVLRKCNTSTWLWALLHDAHEAVTSDIPRPFKCDCIREEQGWIDRKLQAVFHLEPQAIDFALVKQCDDLALGIEGRRLGLPGFADLQGPYPVSTSAEDVQWVLLGERVFAELLTSSYYEGTIYAEHSDAVRQTARILAEAVDDLELAYKHFLNEMEWCGTEGALPQE